MPIKIHVYSVMRNEIVLLPYFLRHYEQFAEKIYVFDDKSDDGTKELLEQHPLVTVLPIEEKVTDEYIGSVLFTRYRSLSRRVADWVICVAGDEFVYHPKITEVLEQCKAEGKRKIKCSGFTMFSSHPPTTSGQIYDEIKRGLPCRFSNKTVVFDPELLMVWKLGTHSVRKNRRAPAWADTGIKLLHYRFLGEEYYLSRCRKNAVDLSPKWNVKQHHRLSDGGRGAPFDWFVEKEKTAPVVEGFEEKDTCRLK